MKTTYCCPNIAVKYSTKDINIEALYEDAPIYKVVSDNIEALGLKQVEPIVEADIVLFVNTFENVQKDLLFDAVVPRDETSMHHLKNFCAQISMLRQLSKKAAVADAGFANGGDREFFDIIKMIFDPTQLSSYAGWNTAGNTIGTALAAACLTSNKAFLLERFIEDVGYQADIRQKVNTIVQNMGLSPFDLKDNHHEIEKIAADMLSEWARQVFPDKTFTLTVKLPWPRTFEIDCDIIF